MWGRTPTLEPTSLGVGVTTTPIVAAPDVGAEEKEREDRH